MAGHAGCRQPVAIEIAGVADVAFDLGMGAAQRKLRVAVVIEAYHAPLAGVVTRLALPAVAAAMNIVDAVAIDARCADVPVAFADVAGVAGDVAVGVPQRKPRPVMVVGLHAPP